MINVWLYVSLILLIIVGLCLYKIKALKELVAIRDKRIEELSEAYEAEVSLGEKIMDNLDSIIETLKKHGFR